MSLQKKKQWGWDWSLMANHLFSRLKHLGSIQREGGRKQGREKGRKVGREEERKEGREGRERKENEGRVNNREREREREE
jgi:hypothetical protein